MPRMVDVGIQIRAIDNTRRAVNSVRRGFRMLRSDMSSLRSPRMTGMTSSLRDVRRQVMATAGVTRSWMTTMVRGSQVVATQTMPRIRNAIKRTGAESVKSTNQINMGFKGINMTMSSSLLSMGLFSTSVIMLGKRMTQATLDMDKYVRGFKVLDGGLEAAKMTMQEIIEVSKLPGIQIPQASESYMQTRSVGISNRFSISILEEFSNAVAIAGGRAIDLRESIRQLGQTISIQKFDMENWRVMLERIPTIRLAVQKAFGPQSIHTEELTKVLEREGMDVNTAWQKIIDSMALQERADPDTITNAVERLQNTLWHMSANIGEIYAPTIQELLKTLNRLVEGFNQLSKPTREFIAFMGTGAFATIGFGLAIYGVSKLIGGMMSVVKGFKNTYSGFMDAPAFKEGGFMGKRYQAAYGAAPDISRRQMAQRHRQSKQLGRGFGMGFGFKDIMADESGAMDFSRGPAKSHIDKEVNRMESRMSSDLQMFDERWGRRHAQTQRKADKARQAGMPDPQILALDERMKHQHDAYKRERKDFINTRRNEIEEIKRTGSERDLLKLNEQYAEARSTFDNIRTGGRDILINQERSIRHVARENLRQNIMRAQEERRILESFADPETGEITEGLRVDPHEIERNLERDRQLRKKVASELKAFDADVDSNINQRESTINKSKQELELTKSQAQIDYDKKRVIENRIKDLEQKRHAAIQATVIDADPERMGRPDLIEQNIRRADEIDRLIDRERGKIKDIDLPDVSILERNIDLMEKKLGEYKTQKDVMRTEMLSTREVELASLDSKKKMADQELEAATRETPRGTVFLDEGFESETQQLVDAENKRAGKRFKEMGDRVRQTETLRSKALANWKAISHIGVLTEVGYGLAIGAGISAIALGAGAIVSHFQNLHDTTSRFDKMMKKHLPTVTKWVRQYDNWKKALISLQGEYDVLTPQMETSFKSELEFLDNLSRSEIGVTDLQSKRMRELNLILKEGKIALDQYGIAFYENLVKTGATELTKHEYVQDAYSEFGERIKTVDKALGNLDSDKLLKEFGPSGLKDILDLRERQIKEMDETLKHQEVVEVNLGGVKTKVKPQSAIGLSISRLLRGGEHKDEIVEYMKAFALDDDFVKQLTFPNLSDQELGEFLKILDLQLELRKIQEEQDRFTQGYEKVRGYGEEAVAKIPDFVPSDLKEWNFALGESRQRLKELKDILLTMPAPIQDFHKSTMQYLESVVTAEDQNLKRVESLSDKYTKAQLKLDVEGFINEKEIRKLLEDAARKSPRTGIMDAIGFKLGQEQQTPEFLDEFNRMVEALGGDRKIQQILKNVTDATVQARRTELKLIEEEITKAISDGKDQMRDLDSERLKTLQRQAQDIQTEDISSGRYLGVRIGGQESYVELLERSLGLETDPLKQDSLKRAIENAKSELQTIKSVMTVRDTLFKEIAILQKKDGVEAPEGPFGYSEKQSRKQGGLLTGASLRYANDVAKIVSMFERIQEINPLSEDKVKLSGKALEDVRESLSKITSETIRWNTFVESTGEHIKSLRRELVSTPAEMRDSVKGEISFLQGLSGVDFEGVSKILTEYHTTYSDLQKLLSVGRGNEGMFEELQHLTKNVPALGDFPFMGQAFSDALNTLKKQLKSINEGDIGKLQRQLAALQKQLDEKIEGEHKDRILGYLTNLQTKMKDVYTGVPPTVRIRELTEELERLERTTGGTESNRISRRIEIEEQIKQARTQVDLYKNAQAQIDKYLPYLGKEGAFLKITAAALARMNRLQQESIDNYKHLAEAKRRDAIQSVIESEILKKQEKTEKSRAIERIRRVGVRSMNNKFLSAADREEQLLSGTYGDGGFEGGVTSSQYKSFMQSGRRALNELDLLEHYYRQYYKADPEGQAAFKERTSKSILEKTGEQVSPTILSGIAGALDVMRDTAGNEVIMEIFSRRENIRTTMRETGSFGRVFVRDLYESITSEASKLYDQTYDALWGALVTGPRETERREEDRQLRKSRQIDDVRELRKDREISAREMRERLGDIEKDYRKESLRLEQDTLIQRERMWQDFFTSIVKGFANVVAETIKARAGLTAGNWLADLLGLDQFPGQSQQQISPQTGFWGNMRDSITKSATGKLVEKNMGSLWENLTGGGTEAAATEGLKQHSIISKFIMPPDAAGAGTNWLQGAQNVGGAVPHAIAARMAIGTILDGFNPKRRTKSDDYYQKNPFNRFLQDIIGVSFDNPSNDRMARKTSFKRANTLARMLGTSTPKDIIKNYDAGVAEGFANMSRGTGPSGSQSTGSDVAKAVEKSIGEQTNAIVAAIVKYGGTNIGDKEVRKALRSGRGIQRQHRSDTNV